MFDLRGKELKYPKELFLIHYREAVQNSMRLQDILGVELKLKSRTTYVRCFDVTYTRQQKAILQPREIRMNWLKPILNVLHSQNFTTGTSNNLLTVILSSSISHKNALKINLPISATVSSFRNEFLTPRSPSDSISRRIRATTGVCRHKNSSFHTVKNNNTSYHEFGKYWMQVQRFLKYRLKYCCPRVIYCICQPKELRKEYRGPSKNQGLPWPIQSHFSIATGCPQIVCGVM